MPHSMSSKSNCAGLLPTMLPGNRQAWAMSITKKRGDGVTGMDTSMFVG
jgi:hypothetical protein